MSEALLDLSLIDLAAALAAGEVTSVAATEAVLAALGGPGRALNAVARLHATEALEAAAACDRERQAGSARGPLHGVPLAHKDMFHRAGRSSGMGGPPGRTVTPGVTAHVLERLDAAGALDVGRLNMVEWALGVSGHNRHTGHPKNAWDTAKLTGGSTSGGATALAAGLLPATLGSDTGGSIRGPAAICGVVGLKPTYGRVSRRGCMPLSFSMDHIGPLARSSADLALMLEVLAGADAQDPSSSRRPVPPYRRRLAGGLRGLRVQVARDGFANLLDQEVATAFETAVAAVKGLGATLVERPLPDFAAMSDLRRLVAGAEMAALHQARIAAEPEGFNDTTLARLWPGFAVPAPDYLRALSARGSLTRRWCEAVFADADLVMLPAVPIPTPAIAATDTGGDAAYVALSNRLGELLFPFNYLGLPVLTTPMPPDASGMPLGLQLVGRPFDEATLLRAGHAIEAAAGWNAARPPRR